MSTPPQRSCPSCQTELPTEARFCLKCGAETPPAFGQDAEAVAERADTNHSEYRRRLQRALGADYELRRLIGQGGFGAVYAAWDKRLEREVAVKALRHDLFPTPALLRRFEREAKAVAKLRHPNILPIYTIGEGEGVAYMVMPLVDGESLRSVLEREGKLPTDDAVRIVMEVAKALEAAHELGFVHRDVKPENIMLEGRHRHVFLMDFGIAKAASIDETGITGSGVVIGSPSYMSPEQARGEPNIDARADIYALGAVAYEMLAGDKAIKAANLHELVYRQATEKPAPLEDRVPSIPSDIAGAIMRCLEVEADHRWQDVAQLRHALTDKGVVGDERFANGYRARTLWLQQVVAAVFLIAVTSIFFFLLLRSPEEEAAGGRAARSGESATLQIDPSSLTLAVGQSEDVRILVAGEDSSVVSGFMLTWHDQASEVFEMESHPDTTGWRPGAVSYLVNLRLTGIGPGTEIVEVRAGAMIDTLRVTVPSAP